MSFYVLVISSDLPFYVYIFAQLYIHSTQNPLRRHDNNLILIAAVTQNAYFKRVKNLSICSMAEFQAIYYFPANMGYICTGIAVF